MQILERHHQRELQRQEERIAIIVELNHHIRDALQSITYRNEKMTAENAALVDDAIKRIDWAMREILSGGQIPPFARSASNSVSSTD